MAEFKTLELAKEYYSLIKNQNIPKHLRDQVLRSSSSIALNLAEGNAKTSRKDRLRVFEIAYGSFRETQAILDLAEVKDARLITSGDRLGAHLYKLIQSLKGKEKKSYQKNLLTER